jgi:hypothetical protein
MSKQHKNKQHKLGRKDRAFDPEARLDLKQIALRCRNTEFNPRRFAAVIMRLREPRIKTALAPKGRNIPSQVNIRR